MEIEIFFVIKNGKRNVYLKWFINFEKIIVEFKNKIWW